MSIIKMSLQYHVQHYLQTKQCRKKDDEKSIINEKLNGYTCENKHL
jgi:hypothetical protein